MVKNINTSSISFQDLTPIEGSRRPPLLPDEKEEDEVKQSPPMLEDITPAKSSKADTKSEKRQRMDNRLQDILNGFNDNTAPTTPPTTAQTTAQTTVPTDSEKQEQVPSSSMSNDEIDALLTSAYEKTQQPSQSQQSGSAVQTETKSKPSETKQPRISQPKVKPSGNDEDDNKKQALLMGLARYDDSKRFGEYLRQSGFNLKSKTLPRKSIEELEGLLNRVRFAVQCKNDRVFSDAILRRLFKGMETYITMKSQCKIQLDGLQDTLWSNDAFLDDLEAFQLEYATFARINYKYRMIGTILSTAAAVNAINKSSTSGANPTGQPHHPSEQQSQPTYEETDPNKATQRLRGIVDRTPLMDQPSFLQ